MSKVRVSSRSLKLRASQRSLESEDGAETPLGGNLSEMDVPSSPEDAVEDEDEEDDEDDIDMDVRSFGMDSPSPNRRYSFGIDSADSPDSQNSPRVAQEIIEEPHFRLRDEFQTLLGNSSAAQEDAEADIPPPTAAGSGGPGDSSEVPSMFYLG
jgi:hypothetical protein